MFLIWSSVQKKSWKWQILWKRSPWTRENVPSHSIFFCSISFPLSSHRWCVFSDSQIHERERDPIETRNTQQTKFLHAKSHCYQFRWIWRFWISARNRSSTRECVWLQFLSTWMERYAVTDINRNENWAIIIDVEEACASVAEHNHRRSEKFPSSVTITTHFTIFHSRKLVALLISCGSLSLVVSQLFRPVVSLF